MNPSAAEDQTGEIEKKAKAASHASRKFDFEDMINADPRCPLPALKIVRAYLRFLSDFEKGAAYVSILDLQVATGLSTRTIIDSRNKLIELGYFVPAGKTGTGAVRYKLSFAPENRVLDHITIARETLRRIDTERKEKQRLKRQVAASMIERNAVTKSDSVIEPDAGPETVVPCTSYGPVIERNAGNYLEEYLEGFSSEGKDLNQDGTALSDPSSSHPTNGYASKSGDDPHLPYPVPDSEEELEAMLSTLVDGLSVAVVGFFRKKFLAGQLTPAMIDEQRRLAS
jgi:hypothetical protein